MRFKGLDLNLLIALDVLIDERSVSRAGEQLHLSQPAMSAALARLRQHFGDALLVPHGKQMIPTAQGQSLALMARTILADIGDLIQASARFDPATSRVTFTISASDYIVTVLLAPLVARLETAAPLVRLEVTLPDDQTQTRFDRGEIDLFITPEEFISPGHPADLLFEETHVVVGWTENPVFAAGLDEAAYFGHGHVTAVIGTGRSSSAFVERRMAALGRHRRIEVTAPLFSAVPRLVVGTSRLATMHGRLAQALGTGLPLAIAPLPFAFPVMREMMQYHQARSGDAGLAWLRDQIAEIAATPHRSI